MNGVTHKYGGIFAGLVAADIVSQNIVNNLTTQNTVDYTTVLAITVVTTVITTFGAIWGAKYPDYDQSPNSTPTRGPGAKILNKFLRGIGATHRSWHTHSIDINLILFGIPSFLLYKYALSEAQFGLPIMGLALIFIGLTTGAISHVLMDMLNRMGAHVICFLPKMRLVPANIGIGSWRPLRRFFRTGAAWENFIRSLTLLLIILKVLGMVYGVASI